VIGQYVADGIVLGATLALGAIGLTLTYNILRFANFAHGEFLTFGAYFALVGASFFAGSRTLGPLTFGPAFLVAIAIAVVWTAALALLLDWLLWRRLRKNQVAVTLVIASFGASLMLRNVVVFVWGSQPEYYSRHIAIASEIVPGVRVTGDEIFVVLLTAALMLALPFLRAQNRHTAAVSQVERERVA